MTMTKFTTLSRGRKMILHQQQQYPKKPRFRFLSFLSLLGFVALVVLIAQFAIITRKYSNMYNNNNLRSKSHQSSSSLDAFFFGPTTINALNRQNSTKAVLQALSSAKGTLPFNAIYPSNTACKDCRIHLPDIIVQSSLPSSLSKTAATATGAVYTVRGQKGPGPNQDRIALITSSQGDFELGVLFDGHGVLGHEHAHTSLALVPPALLSLQQQQQQQYVLDIQSTMIQLDEQIIQMTPLDGGTTAVMAYLQSNTLHLISIGDSTGLVVQYSPKQDQSPACKVLAQAVKHKPGDPVERARIQAAGGIVVDPMNAMDSSRVLFRDTVSGMPLALAMSRSLGDADGKKLNYVISEPSVVSVNLQEMNKDHDVSIFVLLASDGVMDMVPTTQVIEMLGEALYNNRGDQDALEKASLDILELAREKWANSTFGTYRDDMSLLVSKVRPRRN